MQAKDLKRSAIESRREDTSAAGAAGADSNLGVNGEDSREADRFGEVMAQFAEHAEAEVSRLRVLQAETDRAYNELLVFFKVERKKKPPESDEIFGLLSEFVEAFRYSYGPNLQEELHTHRLRTYRRSPTHITT